MAGKGDKPRPGVYSKEYRDNFDKIFGKKKKTKSFTSKKDENRMIVVSNKKGDKNGKNE
tara:strand:- start:37 stop:213 length:177 start_codon:yes stop_codon:yes gene_type:complete